jgi:8-amino-7-oxononanoate synthase
VNQLGETLDIAKSRPRAAIIPIVIGAEANALAAAATLFEQGFYVPAIRFPTVARGTARLRVTVTADHPAADIAQLHAALKTITSAVAKP